MLDDCNKLCLIGDDWLRLVMLLMTMVDFWMNFYYGHGQMNGQTIGRTTVVVKLLLGLKTDIQQH